MWHILWKFIGGKLHDQQKKLKENVKDPKWKFQNVS